MVFNFSAFVEKRYFCADFAFIGGIVTSGMRIEWSSDVGSVITLDEHRQYMEVPLEDVDMNHGRDLLIPEATAPLRS